MNRRTAITAALAASLIAGALAIRSDAAEMKVRAECSPKATIVTLGDLVDLHCDSTSEAERLARIPLFPTPAPGLKRFVSAREIKDMLLIRGIDLIDHQFRGANTVLVIGREPERAASAAIRDASASPRLAEQKLLKTLTEYLNRSGEEPWQIELDLDPDTARWISAAQSLSVNGDQTPATGRQCFEVTVHVGNETKTIDVVAELSLPPLVVVPVRAIPRQSRIRRTDLDLRRVDQSVLTAGCAQRLEDVVGKEAAHTLAMGKPIALSHVSEPVLVRRGDIVTVLVRTAGIRVRTQARARDDGAQGELVAVESLSDRRTYFAQVSGIREVEVLASPVSAGASSRYHSNQG